MICIIIILTLLRQYRIDPMSELKKVLIVTYYWPPAGGPAIQRTLKFVKYLHEALYRKLLAGRVVQ